MPNREEIITKEKFWILVASIIVVALIFGNGELSNKIIILLVGLLLVNPALSFFVNKGIDSIGFKWLEEINFTCEVDDYEFSITAYALLSEILLFILF
jgi:hypothetical protein